MGSIRHPRALAGDRGLRRSVAAAIRTPPPRKSFASSVARPGAGELFRGSAHRLEQGQQAAPLRLLQSLDPREAGRRLRHLPRARGRDGAGGEGAVLGHGVVPGVPPAPGAVPASPGSDHEHDLQAEGRSARDRQAAEGAVPRRNTHELHDMPSLKSLPIASQQQKLWRSLDEHAAAPPSSRELGPAAPPADATSRRSVLQLLGASAALASFGGCLKPPDEKILPYTRQPPEVTPGNPLHYATAAVIDGRATGLLVTANEGRPTKIEGNPDHPSSRGAVGPLEQAELLRLYDPQRL